MIYAKSSNSIRKKKQTVIYLACYEHEGLKLFVITLLEVVNISHLPLEFRIAIRPMVNELVRRRGGLMVSVLVPRSSGLGSSPGRGHSVVFLGKTLYSHSASLHPGV